MKLTFNNYQKYARETAIYKDGIFYPALGLCGESGEVADKIKKIYRDNDGIISEENKEQIVKEMGDVLWYLANMATDLGVTLEDVAKKNLEKIQSRQEKNLIHGEGDNREVDVVEKMWENLVNSPEYIAQQKESNQMLAKSILNHNFE